jgi:pimeloyl-ACP methyl ester carboxylesterase
LIEAMPFVDRSTHRIHYEVAGPASAPPLLLVMGLGFSSRAWDRLPARLNETFRVVVFDNRGTGRSKTRRGLWRTRQMADDAAAVLDAAGIPRASVFGISMGGMIAIELALNHPHRIHRLALGATLAGWPRSKKPTLATITALLLANLRGGGAISRLGPLLVSSASLESDFAEFARWIASAEPADLWTRTAQFAAVALHRADGRVAGIRAPTLVITGDRDLLVPPENSRLLARTIPGARIHELAGAGHCFPVERLEETVSRLTEFFLEAG